MFQAGQSIDFASFGTIEEIEGGEYDFTITAFEGQRARFGGNPPQLVTQFTVDNGPHKGKSVSLELTLVKKDGNINDFAFAVLNTFTSAAGLPMQGIKWEPNPVDFAAQFQKILAEQDTPYRVRGEVTFTYRIDGEYGEPILDENGEPEKWPSGADKKRTFTGKDYDAAKERGTEANRYPGINERSNFRAPVAPAEIAPKPVLPAAMQTGGDGLPESFGAQDPQTAAPGYTPKPAPSTDAPF